ncbi:MAG TPA: hypothetical protein VFI31_17115 [Pirellulales bacterium]|nr:hypothetical protein [Pirellulales bacterium]
MEGIDRFDLAASFVVALLFAAGYGMTKTERSEIPEFDRHVPAVEKLLIWMIVTLFSLAILGPIVVR